MSEQSKVDVPEAVREQVTALTLSADYAPKHGTWKETPEGLRAHPGPIRKGTTVWVHGSGHWRPAVVLREAGVRGSTKVRVVHSVPSNPERMYVKDEHPEHLRARA